MTKINICHFIFVQTRHPDLLTALLAENITLVPDRGGYRPSLMQPLQGAVKVAKFLIVITHFETDIR